MRLLFAFDTRLIALPDGTIWSDGALDYSLWQRYLAVFDEICVLARVRDVPAVPDHARRLDGPNVVVRRLPYFAGPWQFLRQRSVIRRIVHQELRPGDAVMLRALTAIGMCLENAARARGHPYAVEVVGDPYLTFSPGGVRTWLRGFLRWYFPHRLRRQCAGACAAAYVTSRHLQQRYPPAPGVTPVNYSNVDLGDEAYVREPRSSPPTTGRCKLVFVGALSWLHKAPEVLIEAVATSVARGLDLQLTFVGDGHMQPELEALARARGLEKRVHFAGRLSGGQPIREMLDTCDLFVLPSRAEGLPRAMIEAMARGLPCIGTAVGGIPELLADEDLVPPGDAAALADKIAEVCADPERMPRMSARNLETARDYHRHILTARRRAYYEEMRVKTEAWIRNTRHEKT